MIKTFSGTHPEEVALKADKELKGFEISHLSTIKNDREFIITVVCDNERKQYEDMLEEELEPFDPPLNGTDKEIEINPPPCFDDWFFRHDKPAKCEKCGMERKHI